MSSRSATPIFWVGRDVHKDSLTAAVLRNRAAEPMQVDRLPNDHKRIRRYFERLSAAGSPRVCYEASGAGYVLQRALTEWGVSCELAAPSLIPRRPGEHQKTDRCDAIKIALNTPPGTGDVRRPSPRLAMPESVTSSSRPPGATGEGPPSALPSGVVRRGRIRRLSPMPGSVSPRRPTLPDL